MGKLVEMICPTRLGKYSRRPSTRRISFAVGAYAAGHRRIFIAPPSATENGFLLVREPIEYLPSLDGESGIFFVGGMDRFWVICPTGAKCPLRHGGGAWD